MPQEIFWLIIYFLIGFMWMGITKSFYEREEAEKLFTTKRKGRFVFFWPYYFFLFIQSAYIVLTRKKDS